MKYRTILGITLLIIAQSCNSSQKELWDGYEYVFNASGQVHNHTIQKGKPFYVLYTTYPGLKDVLRYTPKGKIDQIIKDNPDWEFVFYCKMDPADSLRLMDKLQKVEGSFPVILDPKGEWEKKNLDRKYTVIGFFCDKSGERLGLAVIGTTQSFFDSEFIKVKNRI